MTPVRIGLAGYGRGGRFFHAVRGEVVRLS